MLSLPIDPKTAFGQIIAPTLNLLPPRMDTREAQVLLLAIALQESGLAHRRQMGNGPARGLWQFEKGGVTGLFNPKLKALPFLSTYCRDHGLDASSAVSVWGQLETNDELACIVARLLLWTDVNRLPTLGNAAAAWDYYYRNWRPGQPRRDDWNSHYRAALDAVA